MEPILIVDDDESIRAMVSLVLEAHGYATQEARSGTEALDLLAGGLEPAVMLVDLMMPGMSGEDLLRALHERCISVPTVVLSGSDRAGTLISEKLADSLLVKPVDIHSLLTVAETWVH